jgi:hypothetical protein
MFINIIRDRYTDTNLNFNEIETVHPTFCSEKAIQTFIHILRTSTSSDIKDGINIYFKLDFRMCNHSCQHFTKRYAFLSMKSSFKDFVKSKIRILGGISVILDCIRDSTDPDVLKNSSSALLLLIDNGIKSLF